ncbi:MAG: serine/threonine-protein kinase, partial [Gemmatimonadales bacterium]
MAKADELLWQRWDEVDGVLDRLLDLSAEERRRELAQLERADPALHELVVRLLVRVDDDGSRVSGPSEGAILGAFGKAERDEPDLEVGTMIGRYCLGARRGRGGMATVYEATRSDGVYQQRVALKVMRRGLDSDDLVRRFLAERQILSSFSHPNIARLLDGGSLPDGRPFLVMELVEGRPITAYADERRLDISARLDLFVGAAGAVHAAHRQLVVHRDLKPSNILVDDEGRVKLLDFGVAKLLDGDPAATDAGARLLTPDYASPEQIRGEAVTTATDVYQLGLLLRELLTGLPPSAGDTGPGVVPIAPSRIAGLPVTGRPDAAVRAAARRTTPDR